MVYIRWIFYRLLSLIIGTILDLIIPKDKNLWLFGTSLNSKNQECFLHNSKYLYLYLINNNLKIKPVLLCDNEDMRQALINANFKNVYARNSLMGILCIIRAKYWLCDFNGSQISRFRSPINKSKVINLWHGTGGIKKCENDIKLFKKSIYAVIYKLFKMNDDYFNVDSEHEIAFRKSAFNIKDSQVIILGSPRLDILYQDIPYSDIFMEKDYSDIKNFKEQGKKLFFYTPTFRDTGKDISGWLKSFKLHKFLKDNNASLICKLHPSDYNSLNFELPEEIYKMDNTSDIYPVLKFADCLISDYSSIYFDFLLLDKPIIYHIPDLEEYQEQCRLPYESYESLTAGAKTRTEDDIISAMQDVINGIDNYKTDRKRLRDQTFKYQDGKNCERVVEWIKGLDK